MPVSPEQKLEIVRSLMSQAGDSVVDQLQNALGAANGDPALNQIRDMVTCEAADRRLRNLVLSPVVALFRDDVATFDGLRFPKPALGLIWTALKGQSPSEVKLADGAAKCFRPLESSPLFLDQLLVRAADGLKTLATPDYQAAAAMLNKQGAGVAEFIACLEVGPVVREAALYLPAWAKRSTEERVAAARISYKDAVAVSEDAGPRYFEMLAAQMERPWTVMRIVAAVMDRPPEAFLAQSELAFTGERLLIAVEEKLDQLGRADLTASPESATATGALVELTFQQVAELEEGVVLSPDGVWGRRLARHKTALAGFVEAQIGATEKAIAATLPREVVRHGTSTKSEPLLTAGLNAGARDRTLALLNFTEAVRPIASKFGFAGARTKMLETVGVVLADYVEEVLAVMRQGPTDRLEAAAVHLECAAEFLALVQGESAAEVVRKRSAALLRPRGDPELEMAS